MVYQFTFADGSVVFKHFKKELTALKWGAYYSYSRFNKLEFHIMEHNRFLN